MFDSGVEWVLEKFRKGKFPPLQQPGLLEYHRA